jgi:hypothetical protein
MADPVTVGVLVASALGMAGDTIIKSAVGEAVRDAYKALKSKVAHWAGAEVEAMEKAPTSPGRRAVVAEIIDAQPADATTALRPLAEQLIAALQASGTADIQATVSNSNVRGTIVTGTGNNVHSVTVLKKL